MESNSMIRRKMVELDEENEKLRAEVERLKGPFTCKHDPEYAGGACAACHADALCEVDALTKLLEAIAKLAYLTIDGVTGAQKKNVSAIIGLSDKNLNRESIVDLNPWEDGSLVRVKCPCGSNNVFNKDVVHRFGVFYRCIGCHVYYHFNYFKGKYEARKHKR